VLVGTCFWSILDRVLDRVSRPPKIRVSIQPYKNSYPDTLPIQNKNPYLQLFRFFRKSMKPEKSDFSGPRIPSPEQFWPAFISPKQPLLIPQAPAHPSSILPSIIHTAIHHPYCHPSSILPSIIHTAITHLRHPSGIYRSSLGFVKQFT
jgi:hypothetical protein